MDLKAFQAQLKAKQSAQSNTGSVPQTPQTQLKTGERNEEVTKNSPQPAQPKAESQKEAGPSPTSNPLPTVRKIGIAGIKPTTTSQVKIGITSQVKIAINSNVSSQPIRKIGVKPVQKPAVISAPTKPVTEPTLPAKEHAFNANSPLGQLMERANKPTSSEKADPAYDEISSEVSAVFQEGEVFSVNELMQDWPDPSDDEDDDADERQAERNSLVQRAVGRLDQIFQEQLADLETANALDPACVELSQITKLTFLRVKQSPAAFDMLGDGDVSVIVRALRVMAEKRRSAVEGKKNAKQTRKDLDAIDSFEEGAFDLANDIDLGFDLGV